MLLALLVIAGAADGRQLWIAAADIDLAHFLPPPPLPDSADQRADLAAVLAIQASRTRAQVEAAQADHLVSVFRFADVLGAGFSAERVPQTRALAQEACRQSSGVTAAAKQFWNRPRPFISSSEVRPVIANLTTASYPSGHATCGYLWAILLADLVPEKRAQLFARGIRYGMNRVIGGVHYPSDVEAGRMSAVVIAAALRGNPQFRAELELARRELRGALGYPGAVAGSDGKGSQAERLGGCRAGRGCAE